MSVFIEERVEIRKRLISDVNFHQAMQHHLSTENTSGLRSSFKWQVYYKQQKKFYEIILFDIEKEKKPDHL